MAKKTKQPPTVTIRLGEGRGWEGAPPMVEVTLGGSRASRDIFDAYRDACLGCKARKIDGEWVNLLKLSDALGMLEAMREVEGIAIDVDQETIDAISDAPPPEPEVFMPPTAIIRLGKGGMVELQLGGERAGPYIFNAYREACGTCRTKKRDGEWLNLVPLADAEPVIERMREIEGLAVDVDSKIIEAIHGRADDVASRLTGARSRLTETDERLAKRGMALYPYQHSGVEWLSAQDGGLLADDMGLGKTVQALIAAPEGDPILVISPAVAKGVWVREAAQWRPDLVPVLLKGRGSFRWPKPGEMVVTNYDILSDDIPPAPANVVVIADEAHALKNPKAARTKRFRKIANAARLEDGRVWLLTATPILGKPPELYSLLQAIDRVPFSSFREFAELMGGYKGRFGYVWEGEPDPIVAERLLPIMLRRIKTEVLTDLPPKSYKDIIVGSGALKKATQKQLDEVLEKWDRVTGRPDVLPPFEMLSEARAILAAAKIPCLMEMVEEYEEAEEPLVVFSAHRAPIDLFDDREGWATITGDTPPHRRTEIEESFQRGELKGVAATIKAGGVAITLTHASNAIFIDQDWTPALNSQAEDRIFRIGQRFPVLITRLIANHALDQRLAVILQDKQRLIGSTIDEARRGTESATDEGEADRLDALADALEEDNAALFADLEEVIITQEGYRARVSKLDDDIKADIERQMEEDWQEEIGKRARSRRVDVDTEDDTRRGPETNVEEWAIDGLQSLRMMDSDHAKHQNQMGFSQADTTLGHQMALRSMDGLSDAEWILAAAMLPKYWRQIGAMPEIERRIPKQGQVGLFDN